MTKKEALHILMESPLYFIRPPTIRLRELKFFLVATDMVINSNLQPRLVEWVKTGHFKKEEHK